MKSGEKRVEKSPRVCRAVIKQGDPFCCFIAVLNTRKDAVVPAFPDLLLWGQILQWHQHQKKEIFLSGIHQRICGVYFFGCFREKRGFF